MTKWRSTSGCSASHAFIPRTVRPEACRGSIYEWNTEMLCGKRADWIEPPGGRKANLCSGPFDLLKTFKQCWLDGIRELARALRFFTIKDAVDVEQYHFHDRAITSIIARS